MWAYDNPNLMCIQVDDETESRPWCDISETEGWCIDDWTEYSEDCSLGIEEFLETQVSLFPNPAKNILNIGNTSDSVVIAIKIYDVLGRLVLNQNNKFNQIDVSHLVSGILFVQIDTDEGRIIKKIIKDNQ